MQSQKNFSNYCIKKESMAAYLLLFTGSCLASVSKRINLFAITRAGTASHLPCALFSAQMGFVAHRCSAGAVGPGQTTLWDELLTWWHRAALWDVLGHLQLAGWTCLYKGFLHTEKRRKYPTVYYSMGHLCLCTSTAANELLCCLVEGKGRDPSTFNQIIWRFMYLKCLLPFQSRNFLSELKGFLLKYKQKNKNKK